MKALPRDGFRVLFVSILTLFCIPAYATLGGDAASVSNDVNNHGGKMRSVRPAPSGGYSVHEFAVNGTQVREYASESGIVFAVAWTGRRHPNLDQLLGSYADEYEIARKGDVANTSLRFRSRVSEVIGSQLVVRMSGHHRVMRGVAFVPSLIPNGVNADEIK